MITDLKELRSAVKANLNRENTVQILTYIGYQVTRDYKFSLRDEKTPSTSIRLDGYIKDFGGDFGGDIVALLHEYKSLSMKEATLYVADCLGVNYD